jgi:trigger factor
MQVTVEAGEGLARRMTVELSADDVEQQVDQRLREVARQARLPGFRPGKVPMRVLRQRFGDSVRGEVLGEMVQSSFVEAVSQEALKPAGQPEIEPDIDIDQRRYAYIASFEVLPQIELNDLSGKRIERPTAEVTDADVDSMIERLRTQRRSWEGVERPAQQGDRLTISFKGTIEGEPFDGGSAEHRQLELGSGGFIPGFESQLEGAAAGEERAVEVSFPDEYHNADLAGKPARFDVTVEEVAEPRLPDIDADFMAAFGIADGDDARFRADVRSNMERELRQRIDARVKEQIMDALIEVNPVELPEALLREEIASLKGQTLQAAGGGGSLDLPDELFAEPAQRRVKLGLVIAEVDKSQGLSASPERVRALVEEAAASYERPQDVIDYYYADPQRLSSMEALAIEELVVARMLESAEVEEVATTFEALTDASDAA